MRSPYLLFKREAKKKTIYYCKIWLPADRAYTTAKSCATIAEKLGIDIKQYPPSARAGARHIAEAWIAARGGVSRKNDPLLWEFCLKFWDWETSDYIRGKLTRGQQIGRHHCASSYYRVKKYVVPRTQGLHLREVTAETLDRLQILLRTELPKQSEKSINMIMSSITTLLREAFRLQMISQNPAYKFRGLANRPRRRGILDTAEIRKLFEAPWDFESHRLAVAVGFYCGMRLGEIMALKAEDIGADFQGLPVLWVRKSWSLTEKREKGTKTGNTRTIPISETLKSGLLRLAAENMHGNGFIFYGPDESRPLSAKVIERAFCKQLVKIGIDEEQRKARNIVFHSLRHSFNSLLRGKIADSTLRLATGHVTEAMTNLYDHGSDSRLAEIRLAQNTVFSGF